jgi:hypothetical protein
MAGVSVCAFHILRGCVARTTPLALLTSKLPPYCAAVLSLCCCCCCVADPSTPPVPDKYARRAQQKLELEVEASLLHAVRRAKQHKDLAFLQTKIHEALRTPGIPSTFPALANATEKLVELQNESRMRLKFFLDTVELETVKKNGAVEVMAAVAVVVVVVVVAVVLPLLLLIHSSVARASSWSPMNCSLDETRTLSRSPQARSPRPSAPFSRLRRPPKAAAGLAGKWRRP